MLPEGFPFHQLNFPTRGQNTLDIFLTNRPSLISKCKLIPGISDHDIVFTEKLTRVPHQKPPSRRILLWKLAGTEGLYRSVHDFSDNLVKKYSYSTDIETLWTWFRFSVLKPSVTLSHPNYPFLGTVSHGSVTKSNAYLVAKEEPTRRFQELVILQTSSATDRFKRIPNSNTGRLITPMSKT